MTTSVLETAAEPRDPLRSRTGPFIRFSIFALLGATALALAYVVTLPPIPLCAFKLVTGRPCPGCGMTRAITALCRGDVATSLRMHPLGLVFAGSLVAGIFGSVVGTATGRDPFWRWVETKGARAAIALAAALVVVWIFRGFVFPEWSPDPIGRFGAAPLPAR